MLLHPEDLKAIEDVVERVVQKKLADASKNDSAESTESAKKGKVK